MRIGLMELIVVVVLILALIKPTKLTEAAHTLGQLLGKVKDNKEEIIDASAKLTKEVNDVVQPLRDAVEPIAEIKEEIQSTIQNGGK